MDPLARNPDLRRSGRTTRLADMYIQHLFDSETPNIKGSVRVTDHHHGNTTDTFFDESKRLIDIIVRRISVEHPHVKLSVDKEKLTITIESKNYGVRT